MPRVLCYFDDLYTVYNYNGQCNGELKAIDDFNKQDLDFKLSYSIDHIHSFKFPLAKSTILTIHSFKHKLYNKYTSLTILIMSKQTSEDMLVQFLTESKEQKGEVVSLLTKFHRLFVLKIHLASFVLPLPL